MRSYLQWIVGLWIAIIGIHANAKSHNVLFIAIDDLRVQLGCYGDTEVLSPNIDRLAARGTLFEHAYCQQTVCNPSRASVLTGMRPDTIRVWDLPTHFRQNRPDVVTLPQLFKHNGYHAQCVGKIFHNWRQDAYKGDPDSWSVPSVLHYNSHANDKPQISGDLPPNLASGRGGIECRDVPDNAYFDGRVADTAVETLREISQRKQPFFLAVGFWKPHTPFNAPKKYWDLYQRDKVPTPKHVNPPSGVPEIALTSARYKGGADSPELSEMHHGHLATISYMDAQIGRVLDELDTLGLRDDTIIVLWSDHGLHLGEHGLTRKTTAFELDAHVPMIISSPDHKAGQRTDALVELLDVYPTLADLCELNAPSEVEGTSLVPLLDDPDTNVKSVAMTQAARPNYPRGQIPTTMGYSMRTERYRFTQWRNFQTQQVDATELYDHHNDPLETTNLAATDSHQQTVKALSEQLGQILPSGDHSQTTASRPNIVFIMADDLGYGDLGCYGQEFIETPNIDRLAREGIRYTQAYAGGPVCTASRAVLMTGLHNGHAPARDNVPHYRTYLQDDDLTVAEQLKKAGYRCGGVGKWSLGDAGTVGRATNQGFDRWFGYLNQDHAHYYFTEYLDDDEGQLRLDGNSESRTHYSHDLLTDRALKFIDDKADDDRPFFLYAAYTLPHFSSPHEDPHGLAVPTTQPYSKHDWSDQAKKYAAMIHRLDLDVGRIVNRIEAQGIRNETLIVFTSDNGGHKKVDERFTTNGPLRGYKRDLTEGGIRVPFIASWPQTIPTNLTSEQVIAFQDMLPTFSQLAAVDVPENCDGISILGSLKGGKLADRDEPLYWDYGHCRTRYDQAVRLDRWKGIRLGVNSAIQLYDLSSDIGETLDVAPEHPEIVQQISEIMATAVTPHDAYPIGQVYRGKPIWKPETQR